MTRVFDVVDGRQENATPQGTPPPEAVPSARDKEDRPLRSFEYCGRRVAGKDSVVPGRGTTPITTRLLIAPPAGEDSVFGGYWGADGCSHRHAELIAEAGRFRVGFRRVIAKGAPSCAKAIEALGASPPRHADAYRDRSEGWLAPAPVRPRPAPEMPRTGDGDQNVQLESPARLRSMLSPRDGVGWALKKPR
jgi:hypothetical protein